MAVFTDFGALPRLTYDLIMCDPPWLFNNWSKKGEEKNATAQYPCLPVDDLSALRVADLASKDAVLWLWATNPMLPQAIDLMKQWGFRYVTAGHWVKRTKHGKLAFGTGYALRCAGEPFLIGAVGRPSYARNVRSVLEAQTREHSRKPDEAYAAAEQMVPWANRRLDLFSREERCGWDAFGNEVGKFEGA
jgi:N6-adenosine-specific RNA methylase IME4